MNIETIFENSDFDNIKFTSKTVKLVGTDENTVLVSNRKGKYTINFLKVNDEGIVENNYKTLEKVIFDKEEYIEDLLVAKNKSTRLLDYSLITSIYDVNELCIREIMLDESIDTVEIDKERMTMNPDYYFKLVKDLKSINSIANSYRNQAINHYVSKYKREELGFSIGYKTNIKKGEFDFLVDRLCLGTKKKKSDFLKYLNKNDISSITMLFKELLNGNVLDSSFMRYLDEYFIKDKLSDIIALGKDILSLGSTNLETKAAQSIKARLNHNKDIRQLETLWQVYFEQNLMYLIFTYRKMFPKVKLVLDEKDKYPDFIGVNHFGGVDIIEIKTHLLPAMSKDKSHHNFAFSSDLSKAIIQTTNYIDALIQSKFKDEEKIETKRYLETANKYRPNGIVIISSEKYLVNKKSSLSETELKELTRDFTKLRHSLHNIDIITFDELIGSAEKYLENIIG